MQRDLVCTATADGYFSSLNATWERVLGWSREELMARPFVEFVHPEDVERTIAEASKVTQVDYELVHFENRYRTKSGDWRWLRWSACSDGEMWFAVASDISKRRASEEALRRSFLDGDLIAYSQPIMDGAGGRIVQEELLARLRVGSGRAAMVVEPSEFVPDAERFGLIDLVDTSMAAEAMELARIGRPAEVNVSAGSISDDGFALAIERELRRTRADPFQLVFEITETAAIDNLDAACDFVERLGRLGCRFALDDFGTGYGSLTYLRHLPVQFLKIDTSFVRELPQRPADQALVRSIVAIARELDLQTVAEGVEDRATLELLRGYGVDHVQGYLFGRPAPLSFG